MRSGILIQARMSSSRLPGKMLMNIGDMPLALWMLHRCALSQQATTLALVTSHAPSDDLLAQRVRQAGFACFRGPLEDVRQRYILAARHDALDVVVRVCGDSPFVDIDMLDALLHTMRTKRVHYARVVDTLPGFVSEAFTLEALEESSCIEPEQVEHVTTTLQAHPQLFQSVWLPGLPVPLPQKFPPLTVDTAQDIYCIRELHRRGCIPLTPAREVLQHCLTPFTNVLSQ